MVLLELLLSEDFISSESLTDPLPVESEELLEDGFFFSLVLELTESLDPLLVELEEGLVELEEGLLRDGLFSSLLSFFLGPLELEEGLSSVNSMVSSLVADALSGVLKILVRLSLAQVTILDAESGVFGVRGGTVGGVGGLGGSTMSPTSLSVAMKESS